MIGMGTRFGVSMEAVFSHGAYLRLIEPDNDFDLVRSKAAEPQKRDKDTGERLWVVTVLDGDPEARTAEVKVRIASPVQPTAPPAVPGSPFPAVEFDGLSMLPWVDRQRVQDPAARRPGVPGAGGVQHAGGWDASGGWSAGAGAEPVRPGPVSADGVPPLNGPCAVHLDADGSRITRLSAHVGGDTGMRVSEYPVESRVVVHLGPRFSESVDMYVGAADLARLIDVLNAAYTRVACRPHADEVTSASGAA